MCSSQFLKSSQIPYLTIIQFPSQLETFLSVAHSVYQGFFFACSAFLHKVKDVPAHSRRVGLNNL